MTQSEFLTHYETELKTRYPWAANEEKLSEFLNECQTTITTTRNTWNHDGEAVKAAWQAIGGKGKPTLKALRALPA